MCAFKNAASNMRAVYQSAIIPANCTEPGVGLKILDEGDERLLSFAAHSLKKHNINSLRRIREST